MKKSIISILIILIASIKIVIASTQGDAILNSVLDKIEEYGAYRVDLKISMGDYALLGYYEIDNQDYYLTIDNQELYGDAKTKYEVYNDRKEVVIDSVGQETTNDILSNPANIFSSIRDNYSADILSSNEQFTILYLKPNVASEESIESIKLHIDMHSMQPKELEYIMQGESIIIEIGDISELTSSIKRYNTSQYSGYEIIDFR